MGGCLTLHLLREQLSPKVIGLFSLSSMYTSQLIYTHTHSPNHGILFAGFLVESSVVVTGPELSSKLPVLMMHGTSDTMIKLDWGKTTATNLLLVGAEVRSDASCFFLVLPLLSIAMPRFSSGLTRTLTTRSVERSWPTSLGGCQTSSSSISTPVSEDWRRQLSSVRVPYRRVPGRIETSMTPAGQRVCRTE
jgi:hypothetical protein